MLGIIDKVLILMASPILIFFGVLIVILKFIFDGRPIFFISVRYSSIDKSFLSIKFRSMINDTDFIKHKIKKYNKSGFETIPISENVYSRFGRILEKTQLVELPQLLNCLKGDLNLVGARPLPIENIIKLTDEFGVELVNARCYPKGGITGLAQIMGKSELNPEERLKIEVMESKFLYRGKWWNRLLVYFMVIFGTFLFVVRNKPCKLINDFILKKLNINTI